MVLVPGGHPSRTLAMPVGHRAAVMSAGAWKAHVHSGMGAMGRTRVWESLAQVGEGVLGEQPPQGEGNQRRAPGNIHIEKIHRKNGNARQMKHSQV